MMADVVMAQATVDIDAVCGAADATFGVEQGGAAEEELEQMTTVLEVAVGDTTGRSEAGSRTVVDTEAAQMSEAATGGDGSEQDAFAGEEEGGAGMCSEICVG